MKKYFMLIIAIIVLIAAAIYGSYNNQMDEATVLKYYHSAAPEASRFIPITDHTASYYDTAGTLAGYIGVSSNIGYSGPVFTATLIDTKGNITAVKVVNSSETPAYLRKLDAAGYFKQYNQKTVTDSLMPKYDIDCVSGATLSSRAIGNSVQNVAHSIAVSELGLSPAKAKIDWQLGVKEIAIAALFVLVLILSRFPKFGKFRLVFLIGSIGIMGFWLNRSLSISQISSLLLGYWPMPQTNLIWYLILVGAIVPALASGKNFYCTYICPFCGLQEVTHAISHTNLPLGKHSKWMRKGRDILLFTVIFIAFISLNPANASYEPFGTIFGLNGTSTFWYLTFFVLVASFIFRRFWCTAFCPVGAFLDKLASLSRDIRKAIGSADKNKAANAAVSKNRPQRESKNGAALKIEQKIRFSKTEIIMFAFYIIILALIIAAIVENITINI
ncbi:FMN-binding protein [Desulfitobacterium sp.]|uniref:FMN-binding protein n=1 Tax=Desulfitobacterium sp. TaxID=49981 RepID=UPI002B20FE9F|nr:FMN-binding protein [Desulfitobacterium sp.]MEA4901607.1 FMN-binding protein [Desulfitobacterium sp.]